MKVLELIKRLEKIIIESHNIEVDVIVAIECSGGSFNKRRIDKVSVVGSGLQSKSFDIWLEI